MNGVHVIGLCIYYIILVACKAKFTYYRFCCIFDQFSVAKQ